MRLAEIQSHLHSGDEETRRSAIQMLKGTPLINSLDLLFSAMGDESWRVRKEAVETFVSAAPDGSTIGKLLDLLRSEDNAGLRNSAAEAVTRLGTAAVLPLIGMVHDSDADVRKFIIDVMGAIGDPAFVQPLLNALQDSDVNVASAAAEHLGSTGDDRVIPELLKAIVANQTAQFRFSALEALRVLAKPVSVPEEIMRLADQDILRKAVYDCLGSISDDSSLGLLMNGLCSAQKGSRSAALKALFRIYGRSSSAVRQKIHDELRSMNGNDVIPGLLHLFDSRDSLLTEALIWCSDATGDIRFIPALIESFEDERLAEAALKSFKKFGSEGVAHVVASFPSAHEKARSAICTLIGESGYYGYSDLIVNALKDHSACVRKAATTAVAKLGIISSISDLVSLTDDTDPDVSSAAVSSLQMFALRSRSEILNIVGQFCNSDMPLHRRHASLLCAALGEHERLLLLAKDEDPVVRQSAVYAIGNLRVTSSGTILVMALVDEHPDVRLAAAEALGSIKENATLDALEQALEDEDTWVRCAALKAIARIDLERALTIIKRVYTGAEGLFMITCLQLLEADGGSDAQLIISSSLTNPDPDIARQASISLERCLSNPAITG